MSGPAASGGPPPIIPRRPPPPPPPSESGSPPPPVLIPRGASAQPMSAAFLAIMQKQIVGPAHGLHSVKTASSISYVRVNLPEKERYLTQFPISSPAKVSGSSEGVNGVLFASTTLPEADRPSKVVLKKFSHSQNPVLELLPSMLLLPYFQAPSFTTFSVQDTRTLKDNLSISSQRHDQALFEFQQLFTESSTPTVIVMEHLAARNLHDISPTDMQGYAQNPKTGFLSDVGRLLAFDIFFHNTDRFPVMNEIGEAANPSSYGNKGNLMLTSFGSDTPEGSLVVIDTNIVPFKGSPDLYLEKIAKLLPALLSEDPSAFKDLVIEPLQKYFGITFSDPQIEEIKSGFKLGVGQVRETMTPTCMISSITTLQEKYLNGGNKDNCEQVKTLLPTYFTHMHDIFAQNAS